MSSMIKQQYSEMEMDDDFVNMIEERSTKDLQGDEVFETDEEEFEEENNLEQLHYLTAEAVHMLEHGIQPSEGWYDEHYRYIYKYSMLGWEHLIERFNGKDTIMTSLATTIRILIQELLDEYSTKPNFNFENYYTLLCNINNIWRYYSQKYVGSETDSSVVDLIEAMNFL
jgi:hypothetical protein